MDVRVCEKLHFDLQFFDNNFSQPTEVCCVLCAGAYSACSAYYLKVVPNSGKTEVQTNEFVRKVIRNCLQ